MAHMIKLEDESELMHVVDTLDAIEKTENSFDYPFEIVTSYESYHVYYSTVNRCFLEEDEEDAVEHLSIKDMAYLITMDDHFAVYAPNDIFIDSMLLVC